MPQARPSTRAERDALAGIRRACYAGLDSISLRIEVAHRLARVIPSDAHAMQTVDPETGLMTHGVGEGIPQKQGEAFVAGVYATEEAACFLDLAASGQVVAALTAPFSKRPSERPFHSDACVEWMEDFGLRHEVRAALCTEGTFWGMACLIRGERRDAFTEREINFLRRVAPHIARGLKAAAAIEASARDASTTAPGMLVFDSAGRLALRSTTAAEYLEDLRDVGYVEAQVPLAVSGVLGRLRAVHARAAGAGEERRLDTDLTTRGRSGCWYTLRASLAEPDTSGESAAMVVIEPLVCRQRAPLLGRIYGLSPRELEVVIRLARGESSKQIALRLGLSIHTVQDHVGRACEKVGARGRKALLAKLFFDGYAPEISR